MAKEKRSDRDRWNQKFDQRGCDSFGEEPSGWLLEHEEVLRELKGGRALDLAAGNGRNSFYLADIGFNVDAIDVSDRAVAWIAEIAARRSLPVTPRRVDLTDYNIPEGSYDLVICFNYLERSLFPSMEKALSPGGILAFETFHVDHVRALGLEKSPRYLLETNELPDAFSALTIIDYREATICEGPTGTRKGVASILARRS